MAITKIDCLKEAAGTMPSSHLYNALRYIANPEKTDGGRLVGSLNALPSWKAAYDQMMDTKRAYRKTNLRQGYHFIISFAPEEEVSADLCFQIMSEFTREYIGDKYEALYSVHNDQKHMHGHLIFNSVGLLDGRKYRYENGDWERYIQPITNKLCEKYGLKTIAFAEYTEDSLTAEPGKGKNLGRRDWTDRKHGYKTWLDFAQADIDRAVKECNSWDEVIYYLSTKKWEIKDRTKDGSSHLKHFTMMAPGMNKPLRPDKLGHGYDREGIIARIRYRIEHPEEREDPDEDLSTISVSVNFDWKNVYRSDIFKKYMDPVPRPPRIIRGYTKGVRPVLTPYQKEYWRMLYRTRQIHRIAAAQIPVDFRSQVTQLRTLERQVGYMQTHQIRNFGDIEKRKDQIRHELESLKKEQRKLFQARFGIKEQTAFLILLYDRQGRPLPDALESTAANLQRQQMAGLLLGRFDTINNSEELSEQIQEIIESNGLFRLDPVLETKNLSSSSTQILQERLEKLYYSPAALKRRKICEELFEDMPNDIEGMRKYLSEHGESFGKRLLSKLLDINDREDLIEALYDMIMEPDRNTQALEFSEYLLKEHPEIYQKSLEETFKNGKVSADMIEAFGENFSTELKILKKEEQKLREEWDFLNGFRRKMYLQEKRSLQAEAFGGQKEKGSGHGSKATSYR